MDCYETPDVPDTGDLVEDRRPAQERQSEGIDSSKRDMGEIFGRFSKAQLNTKRENYAYESLRQRTPLRQSEYARTNVPGAKYESPLERYQRLKDEVAQLAKDLSEAGDTEVEQGINATEISGQVAGLLSSLEQTGAVLNARSSTATPSVGAMAADRIAEEIKAFSVAPAPVESADQITYELYYKQGMAEIQQASQVSALEQRIARLESALGAFSSNSVPLALAVEALSAKVQLLDETRLSVLQKKAVALKEALESSGSAKLEAPTSAKVEELYEGFTRWDAIAQELPALVERLETLRIVHERAVSVVNDVEQLDAENSAVAELVSAASASAAKLEESFVQNTTTIQKNMEHLEARFAALEQKLCS